MCVSCGKFVGVRSDVFDARVKRFGNEDKLLTSYKCRGCRSNGMKSDMIQKQLELIKNTNKEQYQKLQQILQAKISKQQPKK